MDGEQLETTFSGSNTEDMDDFFCHICDGDLTTCACSMTPSNLESRRTSEQTGPATGETLNVVHVPTVSEDRKQRRKQQNRNAQEKYREKQSQVLKDAFRRIEVLEAELASVKAQKEHFRILYEKLETQLLELRSNG